jgi:NAD(P)-dependent dehydrogenase (short-subunit alcohol dehydrogenase family)
MSPNDATPDLTGRTCMITGATSGIGRAAAVGLARLGADLVLVCRDRGRAGETVEQIQSVTGNESVEVLLADLSSQQEIRRVAEEFLSKDRPLHVLVNNAGLIQLGRTTTADGIETTFAVNHLAYFLLTRLLEERLKASAPARIVNVASDVHRSGEITFDDLGRERKYRGFSVYAQSKLANVLFTYELASRLDGTAVTANCMHPGAVGTRFLANNGRLARLAMAIGRPFLRTPEQGARTVIWLASSPEVEGVSGRYFADGKEVRSSEASYDRAVSRRLWETSDELTGLADRARHVGGEG